MTKRKISAAITFLILLLGVLGIVRFYTRDETAVTAKVRESRSLLEGQRPEKKDDAVELSPAMLRMSAIETEQIKWSEIPKTIKLTGELSFNENHLSYISSRISGRVIDIKVDYGQEVKRGELLALIDSVELGEAQSEFLRAQATYSVAKSSYVRAKNLVKEKAISQGEFLERAGQYESAKSELQFTENRLHLLGLTEDDIEKLIAQGRSQDEEMVHHTKVGSVFALRSPMEGRVVERKVTRGEVIAANQTLFTIANLDSLWCFAQIYEKDLPQVRLGAQVKVQVAAYPGQWFEGVLDYIADRLDETTRTVRARVQIENRQDKLKPGMFADLEVIIDRKRALLVPESAVFTSKGRHFVFVEKEPGIYERRMVEVGLKNNGKVEILSGLTEKELVVAEGGFLLKSEMEKSTFEVD